MRCSGSKYFFTVGSSNTPLAIPPPPRNLAEARTRTQLPCKFSVLFYEGKYFSSFGSIFPVEDIIHVIPPEQVHASATSLTRF